MISPVVTPNSGSAAPFTMKIAQAKGGVINDIWRLTHTIMANQTGLNSKAAAMGVIIGIIMKTMPIQSIKKPSKKMINIMIAKEAHLPPGVARMNSLTTSAPPTPMNTPVKANDKDPIIRIKPLSYIVSRVTSLNTVQLNRR